MSDCTTTVIVDNDNDNTSPISITPCNPIKVIRVVVSGGMPGPTGPRGDKGDKGDPGQDGTGGGSGGDGGIPVLQEDLTVEQGVGGSVGGTYTGDFFPAGTPIETVIRAIEIKHVHPDYTIPTLSLSDNSGDTEAGTIVSPVFDITFTQNDAGALSAERLKRNGSTISSSFPYTDTSFQIPDGEIDYVAQVDYLQGPILDDNLGVPDSTGRIGAGTVDSNISIYNGYRKAFYGAITTAVPTNSAMVRALPISILNQSGNEYVLTIPIGTVNVVFAFPDTYVLDHVEYIELSNSDLKPLFIAGSSTVSVEGANGYSPINYTVYSYTPVEPFPVQVHYRIKATTP